MLEYRSMKQLDESHIFIAEKHITRKLICVGWGTGKYLKDLFRHLTRVAGTSQIY